MRRHVWAFSILCTAAALAACGDTGDHFGEFRKNPSPVVASRIAIAMPIIAGPHTGSGTFKLYVTAYADGAAVPVGTQLENPIVINSNIPTNITFNSGNATQLSLPTAPAPIVVHYKSDGSPCTAPIAGITAFNHDANPQVVEMDIVACPTPNPEGGR